MDRRAVVLFVCLRDEGKSQMAAALMRRRAGATVEVFSGGTNPGHAVNPLSARVVAEVGASMAGQVPRPIEPALLAQADRVIVLGHEAEVVQTRKMHASIQTWLTSERSHGTMRELDRMRAVRDDIDGLVEDLYAELREATAPHPWLPQRVGGDFPPRAPGSPLGVALPRLTAWVREGHPIDYGPRGYVPIAALLPERQVPPPDQQPPVKPPVPRS